MKERKYVQNTAKIRPLKFAENVEKWKSPRKATPKQVRINSILLCDDCFLYIALKPF
jgi:hypothetical protein